jgi:hypothetical protein
MCADCQCEALERGGGRQRRRDGEPQGADGTGGGGIISPLHYKRSGTALEDVKNKGQGNITLLCLVKGGQVYGALLAALCKRRDIQLCCIMQHYATNRPERLALPYRINGIYAKK